MHQATIKTKKGAAIIIAVNNGVNYCPLSLTLTELWPKVLVWLQLQHMKCAMLTGFIVTYGTVKQYFDDKILIIIMLSPLPILNRKHMMNSKQI